MLYVYTAEQNMQITNIIFVTFSTLLAEIFLTKT